jgi:hypothetical protein
MKAVLLLAALAWVFPAMAGEPPDPAGSNAPAPVTQATIDKLLAVIAAHEARIDELERRLEDAGSGVPAALAHPSSVPAPTAALASAQNVAPPPPPETPVEQPASNLAATQDAGMGGHNMAIPGGPVLNIRGFFDFNFGVGSIANTMVYPISNDGCGTCGNPFTPSHTAFQAGEFDLFMTSKLSDHLSFLAEVVLGPNAINVFGVDIERYQLTYRSNPYFSASLGRFHTAIGYYNTAYHHGTWFGTAQERPIMYLFEDSGGILPVHMVGLTFTGEVPHTEKLGLHWVGEIGNGLSSNPVAAESVQNFYSDRNYKATNLATYIRPQFLPGIQIGGSWYHDGINPTQASSPLPVPEIRQNIESAYVVFFSPAWEFMTEGVLLSNHVTGMPASFRSPMAYTQIARAFGIYRPYFRYQYVRDNPQDPINILRGTYYGPSIGVRIDFTTYAALKLQFNHLYQSSQLAGNGLNAQIGFTF